jgi:osmoprotectant transport system ATP-binding protein
MNAWVPADANLKMAFSEMLQHNAGWVAVLDGDRLLGVLTPTTLHEALRRSVEADIAGLNPADVELESVARA